eukprot:gene232-biopygen18067
MPGCTSPSTHGARGPSRPNRCGRDVRWWSNTSRIRRAWPPAHPTQGRRRLRMGPGTLKARHGLAVPEEPSRGRGNPATPGTFGASLGRPRRGMAGGLSNDCLGPLCPPVARSGWRERADRTCALLANALCGAKNPAATHQGGRPRPRNPVIEAMTADWALLSRVTPYRPCLPPLAAVSGATSCSWF